jgi:hypothetical protein
MSLLRALLSLAGKRYQSIACKNQRRMTCRKQEQKGTEKLNHLWGGALRPDVVRCLPRPGGFRRGLGKKIWGASGVGCSGLTFGALGCASDGVPRRGARQRVKTGFNVSFRKNVVYSRGAVAARSSPLQKWFLEVFSVSCFSLKFKTIFGMMSHPGW